MRLVIRTRTSLPPGLTEVARRRLEFAMSRFAGRVRSLTLHLDDLNGPRGGVDKHCLIVVRLAAPPREIVIEDVDADPAAVIGRAADRAARAVARTVRAMAGWRPARRR